jgi:hypothetical protein
MPSATSAFYEPLIERELAAIPAAADAFADAHSDDELWLAVTRFAVLAYSPSQHGKRSVMACRAAYDMRDELGDEWRAMIVACAMYASSSRQPWSEPPILKAPPTVSWDELRTIAKGDALLMLDTVQALDPLLGEKGRSALLRMVHAELLAESEDVTEPLDVLVDRAIAEKGSIESVRNVFVGVRFAVSSARDACGDAGTAHCKPDPSRPRLHPYDLARDYAQTLLAHAVARTLPARADEFLAAVHHNLEHGESYAAWSLA